MSQVVSACAPFLSVVWISRRVSLSRTMRGFASWSDFFIEKWAFHLTIQAIAASIATAVSVVSREVDASRQRLSKAGCLSAFGSHDAFFEFLRQRMFLFEPCSWDFCSLYVRRVCISADWDGSFLRMFVRSESFRRCLWNYPWVVFCFASEKVVAEFFCP